MHRAEQEVPRIGLEQLVQTRLPLADPVDLEAELHRETAPLRLEDRSAVGLEVVRTSIELVGQIPDLPCLLEVVDMLGEADLVDATSRRRCDESLDRGDGEVEWLDAVDRLAAEVHVVIDDHSVTSFGA